MERLILHCDCNNFYASCECLEHPEYKNVPLAVAGDPEKRTGVVFAKNDLAKACGVKTTDTVFAARRKCPDIVFVPPRHPYYAHISRQVNAIYQQYTDLVEPASIDESYLDLTGTTRFYGKTGAQLADEIRRRVREEIGVTISVGVSYNKTFAKMGSDYKKPDATTVITPQNYQSILWPLPVEEFLFVGRAAAALLHEKKIRTIGDLAQSDPALLHALLGKQGEQLHKNANGLDDSPVRRFDEPSEIKSVSRGMTFRRDLTTLDEIRTGISAHVDEIAASLRRHGKYAHVVQVQLKSPALTTISRQVTLSRPTCLYREIMDSAMQLIAQNWRPGTPLRAITVGTANLTDTAEENEQTSLFDAFDTQKAARNARRDRQQQLENAIDKIRARHGNAAISFGLHQNEDIGVYSDRLFKKNEQED